MHYPHNSILKGRLESNLLDWCDKCGNSFMMPVCIQSLQVRKHKQWSGSQSLLSAHPPMRARIDLDQRSKTRQISLTSVSPPPPKTKQIQTHNKTKYR